MERRDFDKNDISREQLRALIGGSEEAFTQVYYKYHGSLLEFITALLKDANESEEMTQKIFVDLWAKRHIIDPEKNIGGLLFRIARNYTLNHFKHLKVCEKYTAHLGYNLEFEESPEDRALASEIDLVIRIAIDRMPEKRKQVFQLKYDEGLSYGEIAERLSIGEDTVRTHIMLGRKDIEKVLSIFVMFLGGG